MKDKVFPILIFLTIIGIMIVIFSLIYLNNLYLQDSDNLYKKGNLRLIDKDSRVLSETNTPNRGAFYQDNNQETSSGINEYNAQEPQHPQAYFIEGTPISSCQVLSQANTAYYLTQDIYVNASTLNEATCFKITANNITLVGNNYKIEKVLETYCKKEECRQNRSRMGIPG